MNFYEEKFLAEKLLTQGFPDLNCTEISVGKKSFLEIFRKDVVVLREDGEVRIPIRPVRIVVDGNGRSSFQVWFREMMHGTTNDDFIKLLKKLTRLGGYYLCMGVDNDLYRVNPCSKLLKESSYPCTYEASSVKCLTWFLPPSGGAKGRNSSFMARCMHCSKWMQMTRNLQRVKKRRAIQALQKSESTFEIENPDGEETAELLLEQQADDIAAETEFCTSDLKCCDDDDDEEEIIEPQTAKRKCTERPSCTNSNSGLDSGSLIVLQKTIEQQASGGATKSQHATEKVLVSNENNARHDDIGLLSNLCEVVEECSRKSP